MWVSALFLTNFPVELHSATYHHMSIIDHSIFHFKLHNHNKFSNYLKLIGRSNALDYFLWKTNFLVWILFKTGEFISYITALSVKMLSDRKIVLHCSLHPVVFYIGICRKKYLIGENNAMGDYLYSPILFQPQEEPKIVFCRNKGYS